MWCSMPKVGMKCLAHVAQSVSLQREQGYYPKLFSHGPLHATGLHRADDARHARADDFMSVIAWFWPTFRPQCP